MEKKGSDAETGPNVTVAIAVPATIRIPALRWQRSSTAPRIITWPRAWEKRNFSAVAPVGLYIRRIFEPFLRVQCPRLSKPLRSVGRTGFLEGDFQIQSQCPLTYYLFAWELQTRQT
jgi:hypothetical protein